MATDFDPHNINDGKDKDLDGIIRPQDLEDFTGQDKIVSNLKIFVAAAKMRGESLDHCLFHVWNSLWKIWSSHTGKIPIFEGHFYFFFFKLV